MGRRPPLRLAWAALAALIGSPGTAQDRARAPRIPEGDFTRECPLEVISACRRSCTHGAMGQPDASCPWRDFGCDFKVCWADPSVHVVRDAVSDAATDPASYAVDGQRPVMGGVNMISVVR